MLETNTVSVVLYGNIIQDSNQWLNWYDYCVKKINEQGSIPNYIGVIGDNFNSGKILKLSHTEKKLKEELLGGGNLTSLAVYSLPNEFKQAAFDYNVYFSRNLKIKNSHIILTFKKDVLNIGNIQYIADEAKEFIKLESGQIFEMTNSENPQIYASRVNSVSAFKTLKVIKDFS